MSENPLKKIYLIGIYLYSTDRIRMRLSPRKFHRVVNKTSTADQAEDEHALAMSRACRVF